MVLPQPPVKYDRDNETKTRSEIQREDARNVKSDRPTKLLGARDNPEEALLNLIAILAARGIVLDGTTAS